MKKTKTKKTPTGRQGFIERVCYSYISGSISKIQSGFWLLSKLGVVCLNQPVDTVHDCSTIGAIVHLYCSLPRTTAKSTYANGVPQGTCCVDPKAWTIFMRRTGGGAPMLGKIIHINQLYFIGLFVISIGKTQNLSCLSDNNELLTPNLTYDVFILKMDDRPPDIGKPPYFEAQPICSGEIDDNNPPPREISTRNSVSPLVT